MASVVNYTNTPRKQVPNPLKLRKKAKLGKIEKRRQRRRSEGKYCSHCHWESKSKSKGEGKLHAERNYAGQTFTSQAEQP